MNSRPPGMPGATWLSADALVGYRDGDPITSWPGTSVYKIADGTPVARYGAEPVICSTGVAAKPIADR